VHLELDSGKIILITVKLIDQDGPIGVGTAYFVKEFKSYLERI
jgi:hypothetical protein